MPEEATPAKVRLTDGLGPLQPKRAETPLGMHWLGGVPYMLTSTPKLAPEQRERLISGWPNAGRVRRKDNGEL